MIFVLQLILQEKLDDYLPTVSEQKRLKFVALQDKVNQALDNLVSLILNVVLDLKSLSNTKERHLKIVELSKQKKAQLLYQQTGLFHAILKEDLTTAPGQIVRKKLVAHLFSGQSNKLKEISFVRELLSLDCDAPETTLMTESLPQTESLKFKTKPLRVETESLPQKASPWWETRPSVFLVLGPIGYGKSSFSERLAELIFETYGRKTCHIDGDSPGGLPLESTLLLGGQRQVFTFWQVAKALSLGQIPILSTGGGILFSYGKNPQNLLRRYLCKTLGVDTIDFIDEKIVATIDFIVFVPGASQNLTREEILSGLEEQYSQPQKVKASLDWRVKNGVYEKLDGSRIEKLVKQSFENQRFARLLAEETAHLYTFPSWNQVEKINQLKFSPTPCQPQQLVPNRVLVNYVFRKEKRIGSISGVVNSTTDLKWTNTKASLVSWKESPSNTLEYLQLEGQKILLAPKCVEPAFLKAFMLWNQESDFVYGDLVFPLSGGKTLKDGTIKPYRTTTTVDCQIGYPYLDPESC
jgi:hypothetical protein